MATHEQLEAEAKSYEALIELYSDAYKDLYDVRPGGWKPTKEELVGFWLTFDDRLTEKQDREAAQETRCREQLDAEIAAVKSVMPRASQADIMRYIAEAEEACNGNEPDWEYLDYKMGVKYGTCQKLAEAA